jgi:hypothetical protein
VGGEELAEPALLVGESGGATARPDQGGERIGGYFLIRAADDAAALALARSCPHLRHGGRIEVRRIRPT